MLEGRLRPWRGQAAQVLSEIVYYVIPGAAPPLKVSMEKCGMEIFIRKKMTENRLIILTFEKSGYLK